MPISQYLLEVGLPPVAVVFVLGLVALLRCDKKDIPAIVRALMITEIGRPARAGWAQTVRLIALLSVAAGAVALVMMTSR